LAEFIVATALGIPTDGVRDGGAVWDLTTSEGVRIEVKSAAYLQAWAQKQLSRIIFSIPKTLAWDPDTGEYTGVPQRHAHVYVFALLAHADKPTVNPLVLDQWEFYVLPAGILDARSQNAITLKTLRELTAPTAFSRLRDAVSLAAATFDAAAGKAVRE
jgi:hypothetical protein